MKTIYVDKDIPKSIAVKALKPVWRDAIYSRLSPVYFDDIPEPELPGPRWLRLKNRVCGICATDLHLLHVDADPRVAPVALPGYQRFYLGHEVVSEVVEVGPEVTRFQVGDRVLMHTRFQGANCFSQEIEPRCRMCEMGFPVLCENSSLGQAPRGEGGGWSEGYTAHETELHPVPDDLDDDQAALVEPLSVGVHTALRRLPAAGEKALIVGAGVIGLCVLQAARALAPDSHITVMARYPHQIEMARRLGADEIIGRDEDPYEAAARITRGKLYEGMFGNRMMLGGFDVVYDCVGTARTVQDSLRWTRARGAVVLAGVALAPMSVDLTPVWHQEVDLIGLNSHGRETWNGRAWDTFDLTIALMREGKLRTEGLITHRFPLEKWREAIATAEDKRTGSIKVVFDFGRE